MALRVTMTTRRRPLKFHVQLPRSLRRGLARGWGQMCCALMAPAAPSLLGAANSGMPQTHPGPSPMPPGPCLPDPPIRAFPGARELGTGNHTPRAYMIPISLLKLM